MDVTTTDGQKHLITTYLRRTKEGVRVDVQVSPEVEQFFEKWGGHAEMVLEYGKAWRPITGEPALYVWSMPRTMDTQDIGNDIGLSQVGRGLADDGLVNLSFLRLVGASKAGGISFLCDSVVSKTQLERIGERLKRAQTRFYSEFCQDTEVEVQLIATAGTPQGGA